MIVEYIVVTARVIGGNGQPFTIEQAAEAIRYTLHTQTPGVEV